MVLDEAHRGMKRAADRKTIVSRLIHGEPGSNPPIPIVWGISATIERFTTAMGEVTDRTGYPNVAVDIERVRASGLDQGRDRPRPARREGHVLDDAAARGGQGHAVVRAALGGVLAAEGEPEVLPVLVVQVPDKASDAKLDRARRHDRGGVARPRPAGDRARPGRARAAHARLAHGRLGVPGVDPDRHRRPRRARQGGDLDRVGLPAGGGPLLGAAGEGRDAHRPDHRPHGPPAARPPDRHRRRPQLGHLLPAAVRHEGAHEHQGRARGQRRRERAEPRRRRRSSGRRCCSSGTPRSTRRCSSSSRACRASRRRTAPRARCAGRARWRGCSPTTRPARRCSPTPARTSRSGSTSASTGWPPSTRTMSRRTWRTCCPPRSSARGSPRSARTWGRGPRSSWSRPTRGTSPATRSGSSTG